MNKSIKTIVIIIIGTLFVAGGILFLFTELQNQDFITSQSNTSNSTKKITEGVKAPGFVFTDLNGKQVKLSDFKGKKVMLWMVATWCSSCVAGAQTISQNDGKLKNLIIITLKTYDDAGYPGPSINEFKQHILSNSSSMPNWLWGNASQRTTAIYNPHNLPDIYFLISKDGSLEDIDDAPSATIGKIIKFAKK